MESNRDRWTSLTAAALIAAFGAIAGSFATWYLTRPVPTIVEYSLSTLILGADSEFQSRVPNVAIRVGDEEVPRLVLHTLSLRASAGSFVPSARVAIDFTQPIRLLASVSATPPSSAQSVECTNSLAPARRDSSPVEDAEPPVNGVVCDLGPIDEHGRFEIVVVTTGDTRPTVKIPGPGVQLRDLSDRASASISGLSPREELYAYAFALSWLALAFIVFYQNMVSILRRRSVEDEFIAAEAVDGLNQATRELHATLLDIGARTKDIEALSQQKGPPKE